MDRVITIDGRDVKFRATARTPRLYRMLVMRDLITDMNELTKHFKKVQENKDETLTTNDLTIFENAAYVMARHATPDIPEENPDEWLDSFEMFSIWEILPQILDLWNLNNLQTAKPKKK